MQNKNDNLIIEMKDISKFFRAPESGSRKSETEKR